YPPANLVQHVAHLVAPLLVGQLAGRLGDAREGEREGVGLFGRGVQVKPPLDSVQWSQRSTALRMSLAWAKGLRGGDQTGETHRFPFHSQSNPTSSTISASELEGGVGLPERTPSHSTTPEMQTTAPRPTA